MCSPSFFKDILFYTYYNENSKVYLKETDIENNDENTFHKYTKKKNLRCATYNIVYN